MNEDVKNNDANAVNVPCHCCGHNIATTDDGIPSIGVISDDFKNEIDVEFMGIKWADVPHVCNDCVSKIANVDWKNPAGVTVKESDWIRAGFTTPLKQP